MATAAHGLGIGPAKARRRARARACVLACRRRSHERAAQGHNQTLTNTAGTGAEAPSLSTYLPAVTPSQATMRAEQSPRTVILHDCWCVCRMLVFFSCTSRSISATGLDTVPAFTGG